MKLPAPLIWIILYFEICFFIMFLRTRQSVSGFVCQMAVEIKKGEKWNAGKRKLTFLVVLPPGARGSHVQASDQCSVPLVLKRGYDDD